MTGSRAARYAVAALIVAALIVAALGLAAWLANAPRDAGRPVRPAPAGSPSPSPAAPTPAGQVSLAGLKWTNYDGVELPAAPLAGPRQTAGGLASGYADTATGAVMAAVNIAVRATPQFGPPVYGPTIARQVTGPDAAALLRSCAAAYQQAAAAEGTPKGEPLGPAYVVEQGFRVVAWSPSQATVDIATAGPGTDGATARAVTRTELEWLAGDWRLVAPPAGDWAASAAVLSSLAGFTTFPLPAAPGPLYVPSPPAPHVPPRHARGHARSHARTHRRTR